MYLFYHNIIIPIIRRSFPVNAFTTHIKILLCIGVLYMYSKNYGLPALYLLHV